MTGTASLIRGDSIAIPLRDESVDLIVTSPPYFALRSYQDGGEHYDGQIGSEPTPQAFLEALWAVTAECRRVLKPSGSMFVNLGDKYSGSGGHNNSGLNTPSPEGNPYNGRTSSSRGSDLMWDETRNAARSYNKSAAVGDSKVPAKSLMLLPERYRIGCVDQLGMIARAVIIWDKPNGLPESVTDRVRRSHEDWVHLTKQPRYYAAVDEIRVPQEHPDHPQLGKSNHLAKQWSEDDARAETGHGSFAGQVRTLHPLGKLPGSVWRIPSEPLQVPDWVGVDHYAAYPQEWPRRLILGFTPPGHCTACRQARTPVVEKTRTITGTKPLGSNDRTVNPLAGGLRVGAHNIESTAVMTGYACACPTPNAPTRPAVVLDPFSGTGTTVMVARALGRHGVGIDLSADYHRLATWRIWSSGHAKKTNERTWLERQGALPLAGG